MAGVSGHLLSGDSDELAAAIEAVNNACENPFKVTKSEMPERPKVDNSEIGPRVYPNSCPLSQ